MSKRAGSESTFEDFHERPTAQHPRPASFANPEPPPRPESGTRPVTTREDIDRYVRSKRDRERTAPMGIEVAPESARERETLDALTVQRETLVMRADAHPTGTQIPIDIDLSRIAKPRPAAGQRPAVLARIDRRHLTIGLGFLVAMVSALAGFIAGRASL